MWQTDNHLWCLCQLHHEPLSQWLPHPKTIFLVRARRPHTHFYTRNLECMSDVALWGFVNPVSRDILVSWKPLKPTYTLSLHCVYPKPPWHIYIWSFARMGSIPLLLWSSVYSVVSPWGALRFTVSVEAIKNDIIAYYLSIMNSYNPRPKSLNPCQCVRGPCLPFFPRNHYSY